MSHVSDTMRVGPAYYPEAAQSDGGDLGVALPKLRVVEFGAVTTLTSTGVCVNASSTGAVTLSATGSLTSGGVATFDIPRNVTFTSTDNLSGFTLSVAGTDQYGKTQTEAVTGPNNTTVGGVKAFKTISTITTTGAFTGTSRISAGSGDVYGLPNHIADKGKVLGLRLDGSEVGATVVAGFAATGTSTATTADVRGTLTATTASNGTRRFTAVLLVNPTNKETLYGATPA